MDSQYSFEYDQAEQYFKKSKQMVNKLIESLGAVQEKMKDLVDSAMYNHVSEDEIAAINDMIETIDKNRSKLLTE